MKSLLISFFICIILSLSTIQIAHAETIGKIAAIVNDELILEDELNKEINLTIQHLQSTRTQAPPTNILREKVLEHVILTKLQLWLAEKSGIIIDDEQLNGAIRNIAQSNKLTISDLGRAIEAEGGNFEQFRERIRTDIIINQLITRFVKQKVNVSEKEIANYLLNKKNRHNPDKEYLLAHLLVEIPEAASSEQISQQQRKAEKILKEIKDGADFSQMVVSYSDGNLALKGGLLEWRTQAQLPTIFTNAVSDMTEGNISNIIRSPSGFHIIKLTGIRGNTKRIVNQTKSRHILVIPNEILSSKQAQIKLENLRERIIQGENFADIAQAHSDDKTSAVNGGAIDWMAPGILVPEFQKELDILEINQISKVFKSRFGWHIVQPLGRRKHDDTDAFKKANAIEDIRKRKTSTAVQLWLRKLRDEAYVEIRQ